MSGRNNEGRTDVSKLLTCHASVLEWFPFLRYFLSSIFFFTSCQSNLIQFPSNSVIIRTGYCAESEYSFQPLQTWEIKSESVQFEFKHSTLILLLLSLEMMLCASGWGFDRTDVNGPISHINSNGLTSVPNIICADNCEITLFSSLSQS